MRIGDRVKINRDLVQYPSKGCWPVYQGKRGTLISLNRNGGGTAEYGVSFSNDDGVDAWFKRYEISPMKERK